MMSEKDKVGETVVCSRRAFRREAHSANELGTISQLGPGTFPVTSVQLDSVRLDSLGLVCHSPST